MINEAAKYLRADFAVKKELVDYYNQNCFPQVNPKRKYRMKTSDNWCAMFTTVIAHKCGLQANQFPYEVSVYYQSLIAKDRGLFFKDYKQARPNDLIIFDWNKNGTLDHVGFVVSNSGGKIKTIEGNIKNTVGYRTINGDAMAVHGFIQTNYETLSNLANSEHRRIEDLARRTIKGEFGNGLARITALKGDYVAVQRMINHLLR